MPLLGHFIISSLERAQNFSKKPAGFGANQALASSGFWPIQCGPSIEPMLSGSCLGPFKIYFIT